MLIKNWQEHQSHKQTGAMLWQSFVQLIGRVHDFNIYQKGCFFIVFPLPSGQLIVVFSNVVLDDLNSKIRVSIFHS